MINDHERDALRELQRRFDAEDPPFTRSFKTVGRDSHFSVDWAYRLPRWGHTLALIIAIAAGLMIAARELWPALLFMRLVPIIMALSRGSAHTDEPPPPRTVESGGHTAVPQT